MPRQARQKAKGEFFLDGRYLTSMGVEILIGDVRSAILGIATNSVHCVVTSPPYWGLRDYGVSGQIGLEPTYQAFITEMVAVFREVRRVLRPDGTLWLNLGDSYASTPSGAMVSSGLQGGKATQQAFRLATAAKHVPGGLKPKDLCGIPWRVALALQEDGWWLRQDIIWSKPNPMPESCTDRCTKSHEYLFLFAKNGETTFWTHRDGGGTRTKPEPDYRWVHKETGEETITPQHDKSQWKRINLWSGHDYYYDAEAIKEDAKPESADRYGYAFGGAKTEALIEANKTGIGQRTRVAGTREATNRRNRRSVWEIATSPFPEAHFATFPPALVEPCIKAGTSEKGCCSKCGAPWVRETQNSWSPSCKCNAAVVPCTVLDPFGGAGTTGLVADRLQRNAILIELNAQYAEMARQRIANEAPLLSFAGPPDHTTTPNGADRPARASPSCAPAIQDELQLDAFESCDTCPYASYLACNIS